jgi:hypothetical protein
MSIESGVAALEELWMQSRHLKQVYRGLSTDQGKEGIQRFPSCSDFEEEEGRDVPIV